MAKGKHGSFLPASRTEEFGAKLTLLFDLCVAEAEETDPKEVCVAYEMILGLLEEIDRFDRDDIVFWADEPGTWQLGIDWARVIPPYLACLSKVLPPQDFQERAVVLMGQLNPLAGSISWSACLKPSGETYVRSVPFCPIPESPK